MTVVFTAVCDTTMAVPDKGLRSENDRFRNAALLPTHTLEELEVDPFEYVEVKPDDESNGWAEAIYLQAVPLADEFEYRDSATGLDIISMRTNILQNIDVSLEPGDQIEVRGSNIPISDDLRVKRSYADDRLGERCYLSEDLRERLGVADWGDLVEVLHPETGGRIILPAWPLKSWDPQDSIGLDLHSRELLDVSSEDTLRAQQFVSDGQNRDHHSWASATKGLRTRLLDLFIDRQTASLRVLPGLNRDEHRNIARVDSDIMDIVGLTPGELATIRWKGRTHKVQLLSPPDPDDHMALSIKLPSTERDQVNVSIGDAVQLQRNIPYIFKKNMAISIFSVIGVVIGTFTIVSTLGLVERYSSTVGYLNLAVALGAFSVLISIVAIWIVFYPERQAVTESETREG